MKHSFLRSSAPIAAAAVLILAPTVAAQRPAGRGMRQGAAAMTTPWRELNGFQSLLHLSHQPLMQSGDLAPARRNSGLLAQAAEDLAKSTAPAECNPPAGPRAR